MEMESVRDRAEPRSASSHATESPPALSDCLKPISPVVQETASGLPREAARVVMARRVDRAAHDILFARPKVTRALYFSNDDKEVAHARV
jgi:hypothetical protein